MRELLRQFAGQGRTVLVSSHVLTEVEQLVDRVVIINRGRLVRQATLCELAATHAAVVAVRTPQTEQLATTLSLNGATRVEPSGPNELRVTGLSAAAIGHLAFLERIELHELATERSDLEDAFFALTEATHADTSLVNEG